MRAVSASCESPQLAKLLVDIMFLSLQLLMNSSKCTWILTEFWRNSDDWKIRMIRSLAHRIFQPCPQLRRRRQAGVAAHVFGPTRCHTKDRIEILKFWIQFFTNFGNFTDFSSKFCKISGTLNEFRHFWTCSRNPDKILSKFGWEIAFFKKKTEISNENSIFNLAKLWLIFMRIFEVWAVQKYANLVDLEKSCKMRLLSLS